jgi:hypothetical protein
VKVIVWENDDMWNWADIRGEVVEITTRPEARGHIDELANNHPGVDGCRNPIPTDRVIPEIAPSRQSVP